MGFLDTTNNTSKSTKDSARLAPGVHRVTLTELKWVASVDKGVLEFTDATGAIHTEWLEANSDGQKNRVKALLLHLCSLCGVTFDNPADMAAFNALGAQLVAAGSPLVLGLEEYEYVTRAGEARTKVVTAGRFDQCIHAAAQATGTDLDAF